MAICLLGLFIVFGIYVDVEPSPSKSPAAHARSHPREVVM